jgi:hypothetical protein
MLEISDTHQKVLDRFWIEISVAIIILALFNGVILGFFYITQQKVFKTAGYFFENQVRSALIIDYLRSSQWPTLAELVDKIPGQFEIDAHYAGILTSVRKQMFFIPTYTDFACTIKTSYFPEKNAYVRCIGKVRQINALSLED